jgi:uncharacterized protein (TIGR02246 family)
MSAPPAIPSATADQEEAHAGRTAEYRDRRRRAACPRGVLAGQRHARDHRPPASTAAASTDPGALRRTIDSLNANSAAALKRGDTTAFVANYAADAVVMMPGQKAFRGRDALRSATAGMLATTPVKDFTFNIDDLMVGGDLAVETGTYVITVQPKRGGEVKEAGKYLTVWKRQPDGSWKIVRDIMNADPAEKT